MTAPLHKRRLALAAALPTAVVAALVALPTATAHAAPSTTIVINEVYGAGGNTGATYTNDFIELKNIGTTEIDVSDWSVQYASATGATYQVTNLTGQIPAGDSYLVQEAAGTGGTAPLPGPDASGSIAMAGGAGKVALVNHQNALTCTVPDCDTATGVVDYVGYGPTANDSETAPTTAALTSTTSASRDADGTDADNNSTDFTAGAPSPVSCGEDCVAPAQPSTIAAIQGAAHLSPLSGDGVTDVTGVVTALKNNGYFMQDPRGNTAPGWVAGASSAIFVFTSSAPTGLSPGTSVSVDGTVSEFRIGATGLTTTELVDVTTTVLAPTATIPAPTLVGPGGLAVPTTVIDNDAGAGPPINVETAGQFQPAEDGIDFWESLEGMRVSLEDARVVGPTNTQFGETPIVPAGSGTATARGGIVLLQNDPNPERIILDNGLGTTIPKANVGDTYAGVTEGIVDFDFGNFHLFATATPTLDANGLQREVTPASTHEELSVATFNVENLDPTDPPSKFEELAEIIVDNMASPDLVTLEEVQDNNGATNNGVTAADQTLQELVDAIEDVGGPSYTFEQIDPVNNEEGGEPGGNIRVAFLIQEDTPLSFVERDPGNSTTDTDVTTIDGQAALTHSPGRVDPSSPAWDAARVPLAGEFMFGGQKVFVVANHWSSKGGDQPLFGPNQPPFQSSEAKRVQQAQSVTDFVDEIFAEDPDANVVVAGDLNDFEYADSVMTLREGGSQTMTDLPATLPASQRYTYVFEGNSQVLDHIVISPGLVNQGFDYDVLHVNAEFNDQVSDHDPQVVDLQLGLPAANATTFATPGQVVYGNSATVSGELRDVTTDEAIGGAEVVLQSRAPGTTTWTDGDTATTDADGNYTYTVTPERNTQYRVVFIGDATHASTRSNAVRIDVATRVTLTISDQTVKKGTTVLFTGLVSPDHRGQTVQVQRQRANHTWETMKVATLNNDSIYTFRWKADKKGMALWRVVKPADSDHVKGVSRQASVKVS